MLDDEVRTQKLNQEKLISDFESERLVLKNMVTVTESVMEDAKIGLNKVISDHIKANEASQEENKALQEKLENDKRNAEVKLQDKEIALETALKELFELKSQKQLFDIEFDVQKEHSNKKIAIIAGEIWTSGSYIEGLESQNKVLNDIQDQLKKDMDAQKENWEKEIAVLTEEVVQKVTWIETLQSRNNDLSDTLQRMKNGKYYFCIKQIDQFFSKTSILMKISLAVIAATIDGYMKHVTLLPVYTSVSSTQCVML